MRIARLRIYILLGLFLSIIPVRAQDGNDEKNKRFKPSAGLTYNLHTMEDLLLRSGEELDYVHSHFPGIEVGFVLEPEKTGGWILEYRNTFLGELAIFGIAKRTSNPYNGFLGDIVDRTIGNGFLGRLDMGKTIIGGSDRNLEAGFIISDKVVLGTDTYPLTYWIGDEETYTNTGFHFTPGVFASYARQLQNRSNLSANISLSQSFFNLHQFDQESSVEHFVLPLFTEVLITYQMKGGFYIRSGAMYAASLQGVPADARFNLGAGYTFRYP